MKRNIIITIISTIILLGISNNSASALTYSNNVDLEYTFAPTLDVSFSSNAGFVIEDLTPGTAADSNVVTVTASSNSSDGFTLAATAGKSGDSYRNNNRLVHSNNTNYFESIATNADTTLDNLGTNKWGYSVCTAVTNNTCSTWSNYNGLPAVGSTGTELAETNSAGSTSVDMKIGASSTNTQVSGTFTNNINFAMTAKIVTYNYSITYDQNATGTVSNLPSNVGIPTPATVNTGGSVNISSNNPTTDNANFLGWCQGTVSDATCTGTLYQPGDYLKLTNASSSTTNAVTLVAVWESTAPATPTRIEDVTYMQQFASLTTEEINVIKGNMTMGDQYQLTDQRDGKKYYVSKLQDGNIWMTQNLDHDIVTTTNYYTPENTDVTASWTASSATLTSSTPWNAYSTTTTIQSIDPGDKCWDGTFNNINLASLASCVQDGNHYHIGNYYNWSAAVANNDTSGYTYDTTGNGSNLANTSICPAGWGLPRAGTGNDTFYGLTNGNYSTGTALAASPAYFVPSGDCYPGAYATSVNAGSGSLYWSAVSYNDSSAYNLYFSSNIVRSETSHDRSYGLSIRCLARPLSASIVDAYGLNASCFPAGSQVLVSGDGQTRSIENIKVGDSIVSYDTISNRYYETEVTIVTVHGGKESSTELADLILDDGTTLTMTLSHPVLTSNGFRAIENSKYPVLTEQDIIMTTSGAHPIRQIRIYEVEPTVTYNIEIKDYDEDEDDNTYDNYIVNGVIVHNGK